MVFVITPDFILGVVVFMIVIIVWMVSALPEWIDQRKCNHDEGVYENSACQAICKKCGMKLGFIDDWRKNK